MRWFLPLAVCALVGCSPGKLFGPPLYESDAKILVRYVVDSSAASVQGATPSDEVAKGRNAMLSTEVEILTSADLAMEVAQAIGYNRLGTAAGLPSATASDAA